MTPEDLRKAGLGDVGRKWPTSTFKSRFGLSISLLGFDYHVKPDRILPAAQVKLGRKRLVSRHGYLEVNVGRAARVDAGR
jgi:hypothetical protein